MNGKMMITYKILCKADINKEIRIQDILSNDKIAKAIKSEYAKGFRNITLLSDIKDASIKIESDKKLYSFEVEKNDFADILVLAEEDASSKKLIKKDCDRVELVNIETL